MLEGQVAIRPSAWTAWLLAARPATLPAAAAPVLVGTAAAATERFRLDIFIATMAVSLLIQIGTNFANDLFDFQRGADTPDRLGPLRVTQSGLIPSRQVRNAIYLTFGLAAAIGLYLVVLGGWPILAIGLVCIAAGLAYTGGPWPLGYHGLGDLVCFLLFGLAAVMGTYYLQAEQMDLIALLAALPVGCLVTAIIVVNNLRDIETDRRAGKLTLAVRLGDKGTRVEYALLVLGAYALLPLVALESGSGWVWLAWTSLPLALPPARAVLSGLSGRPLNLILKRTAQLHLVFGALLALGLLL